MKSSKQLDIRLALIAELALLVAAAINIRQLLGHGTRPATVIPVVCIILAAILMSLAIIRMRLSSAKPEEKSETEAPKQSDEVKMEWQSRNRQRPRDAQ